jgi:hypothetical protein
MKYLVKAIVLENDRQHGVCGKLSLAFDLMVTIKVGGMWYGDML